MWSASSSGTPPSFFSSSSITPSPYIYRNLGFDMLADLKPVASVGILDGMLMLVDAKSPVRSVPEFIASIAKEIAEKRLTA